jgi:hypothetical protein
MKPDNVRLPKLAHIRVDVPGWRRRFFAVRHELQQIREWFRRSALARQEANLAINRAGLTRRRAQQIRELSRRVAITPRRARHIEALNNRAALFRQELLDIMVWRKSVETRMLNALIPPPRQRDVATAA